MIFLPLAPLLCACGGEWPYSARPGAPALADRLQETLESARAEILVPGAVAVIVWPDGSRWTGTSGLAQIERQSPPVMPPDPLRSDDPGVPVIQGQPMTTNPTFRAASVVKSMLATAILQLADQGRLTLEDRIETWLPGLVPDGQRITLRQLLNHTSGLFNYTDNLDFFDQVRADPQRRWRPEELVHYGLTRRPYAEPGKIFAYSNTNYILAGMIAEKAAGQSLADLLATRIIRPLGLKSTYVPNGPAMPHLAARGYRFDFLGSTLWRDYTDYAHPSWTWAAGALVTDMDDLLVWLEALLSGRLLAPESRRAMFTWIPGDEPASDYGLGVGRWQGAMGANGDELFGYQCCLLRYRGLDVAVMVNGQPAKLGVLAGATLIFWRLMSVAAPG